MSSTMNGKTQGDSDVSDGDILEDLLGIEFGEDFDQYLGCIECTLAAAAKTVLEKTLAEKATKLASVEAALDESVVAKAVLEKTLAEKATKLASVEAALDQSVAAKTILEKGLLDKTTELAVIVAARDLGNVRLSRFQHVHVMEESFQANGCDAGAYDIGSIVQCFWVPTEEICLGTLKSINAVTFTAVVHWDIPSSPSPATSDDDVDAEVRVTYELPMSWIL